MKRRRYGSLRECARLVGGLCLVIACHEAEEPLASAATEAQTGATSEDADEASSEGGTECMPTTAALRTSLFDSACNMNGCHDSQSAAGGLDLTVPDIESQLVGAPSGTCNGEVLIVPGDASESFFRKKLGAQPVCGMTMPLGDSLSDAQLGCVDAWIAQLESQCEMCGGDTCVDLLSAAGHCGACGEACPPGIACSLGTCDCPDGTEACDGECIETVSDPSHCGDCGNACAPTGVCLSGSCANDCGSLTNCGGACVDLDASPVHCGDCDAPCGAAESCIGGTCGCEADPSSYAASVEPILVAQCAGMGCHRPMGPMPGAEGLNLSSGAGYAGLVEVPSVQCADRMLVEPGSPGSSYLYNKILGVDLCSGTKMPKGPGEGLSDEELQMVSDWICGGADP